MYTSTIIAKNIKERIKDTPLSLQALWKKCDMGKNSLSHMKDGSMPSGDKLGRIADCLNCSVDFLLGRSPSPAINVGRDNNGFIGEANAPVSLGDSLSAQERDLLQIFRNANGKRQVEIMQFIYGMEGGK